MTKATILAVDDTPGSLMLLVRILTPAGYDVHPAESGELALAAVAANPPDLILLVSRCAAGSRRARRPVTYPSS